MTRLDKTTLGNTYQLGRLIHDVCMLFCDGAPKDVYMTVRRLDVAYECSQNLKSSDDPCWNEVMTLVMDSDDRNAAAVSHRYAHFSFS